MLFTTISYWGNMGRCWGRRNLLATAAQQVESRSSFLRSGRGNGEATAGPLLEQASEECTAVLLCIVLVEKGTSIGSMKPRWRIDWDTCQQTWTVCNYSSEGSEQLWGSAGCNPRHCLCDTGSIRLRLGYWSFRSARNGVCHLWLADGKIERSRRWNTSSPKTDTDRWGESVRRTPPSHDRLAMSGYWALLCSWPLTDVIAIDFRRRAGAAVCFRDYRSTPSLADRNLHNNCNRL